MARRMLMSLSLMAALLLPGVVLGTNHQINIQGFAFVPAKTKVNYGDTVTWKNLDAATHTVTSTGSSTKAFNSGNLAQNQTFSIIINPTDRRGPFPYFCAIHPAMVDTVFVATRHTITISNFDFAPGNLVINPGDTVVWVNQDAVQHTSTSDASSPKDWNSGLLSQGASFQLRFPPSDGMGPFPYHCTLHPSMKDTVRINPFYCCQGTTGNVNMTGIVDVSDLSLLVAYLTAVPQPSLPCATEANVNSAGIVDISDLSLLVAYLTVSPPPALPTCPL